MSRTDRHTPAPPVLVVAHEADTLAQRISDAADHDDLNCDTRQILHTLGLEVHRFADRLRAHHPALGRYRPKEHS